MQVLRRRGLGMSRPAHTHQIVCKKLLSGLDKLIERKSKRFSTNLLYENGVKLEGSKNGEGEIVPDISFYNKSYRDIGGNLAVDDLLFLIEVSKGKYCERTEKNIKNLFARESTLQEAFLYYYEIAKWVRYTRVEGSDNPLEEETDKSEVFGVYLHKYLLFDPQTVQKEECWTDLKK